MIRRWIPLLLVLLAPVCCPAFETPANTLTDAEKRSGWELLFDGKSTDGWRNYRKDGIGDGWQVQDGALTRAARGAGDIITKGQYEYFELALEYRISKGGNSGVMFHVTEEENTPWKTGPEIQIQDNVDGHDPQKAGWLYQLYQPPPNRRADATRPAGEWNHLYVRVDPDRSEVVLNGVSYYYFKKGSPDWDRRVARSKFAKFEKFGKATSGHICLQDHGNEVAYRSLKIRRLSGDSVRNPVDGEVKLKRVAAFPNLEWEGWEPVTEAGRPMQLRPLVMTSANDDSGRLFVATQDGMIHTFANDPEVTTTKMFLDLRPKTAPWKKNNEEGLLGLAFHPDYKANGRFYVYYSSRAEQTTSVISEFQVSKDDPNRADPDSERVVMKIKQPYWNHNGGAIEFGPDGFLYIGLGDGGSRNDPHANGQNLETLLGSILRIDVDSRSVNDAYGIPKDNPFVDREGARPEIFSYGWRNVWRLAFDSDGDLWAADVGQDLWEEINIVKKGGNYGWSMREASYPFGNREADNPETPIAPIWEYDHRIGKSITGGYVYSGSKVPQLAGKYIYADYVTGRIWALDYDKAAGRVRANLGLADGGLPVLAFAQDTNGEVYYLIETLKGGEGIYRFEPVD